MYKRQIYTLESADNCNRGPLVEMTTIDVLPAPLPEITIPSLPVALTCEEVATYSAPIATYTNNATSSSCLIDGNVTGVIESNFTACGGGNISITWTVLTGCSDDSVEETAIITVTPPPLPEITIPTDQTICIGDSILLSNLIVGSTIGTVLYGTTFGSYPTPISTFAKPTVTTTYFIRDSLVAKGCRDTAMVTIFVNEILTGTETHNGCICLLYTSPSPRD